MYYWQKIEVPSYMVMVHAFTCSREVCICVRKLIGLIMMHLHDMHWIYIDELVAAETMLTKHAYHTINEHATVSVTCNSTIYGNKCGRAQC